MWIGLILTVILLSEAVTGLILAEPWMIGETEEEQSITKNRTRPRGLHEGKIGTFRIRWFIDLAAIGMILLTLSGIYLSVPILRMGKHRR